ncbi:hypothetical protein [uncultured Winogradskyella sp.]|uniref:hypothetical protein n=1 Tax=uncultured Winogradskyella sp. TaxID=395353 RepID=UPI002631B951|nr:hypothetical protein [uncultured Winogradskyella sp.]
MKNLYTFFIFLFLTAQAYAQYQSFQLVLVDSATGYEADSGCADCGNQSNDEGLNTIFETYNVVYYQMAFAYSANEDFQGAIHMGAC